MTRFIIVQPANGKDSAERAEYINMLLWDIVKHPTSTGTTMLFPIEHHPDNGLAAIKYDEEQVMPLQNAEPLALLVAELSGTVPNIEQAGETVAAFMGQTVTFYNMLPAEVVTHSVEELAEWGWFAQELVGETEEGEIIEG